MQFPRAQTYQTNIQRYLVARPPAAPRPTQAVSALSRTRVFLPGDGSDGHHIDVDDWDSLAAISVASSDSEDDAQAGEAVGGVHGSVIAFVRDVLSNFLLAGVDSSAGHVDHEGLFQCCICYDTYVNPVVTLCMHIFCLACINRVRKAECPLCRAPINEAPMRDALFEAELARALQLGIVDKPNTAR
ncbi:hypothetical protein B0H11DRAFT_2246354 [Mycena galericulata]|nr:hypothetical protein B0H11DRAFT_2246354 [Mycena galericulata]